MENNLMKFENEEFGRVRSMVVDNEPWFVGKDIAEALGYSNPSKAVIQHVFNEDKQFFMMSLADSQNGNVSKGQTKTAFIRESGVYSLIFGSKLESAKKFKKWVTGEVLPSIRKHGGYLTPDKVEEVLLNPDTIIKLAQNLKDEQQKRILLEKENNILKPKATYCDKVLESTETMTITQIAKDYGMSAKELNKILNEEKIQYKVNGQWVLYSQYQDKGYTESETSMDRYGNSYMNTKWTQAGRLFIYEILTNIGIYPNEEKEIKKLQKAKINKTKKISIKDKAFAKLYGIYQSNGINKSEFAQCCSVTTPTLNKMINKYENTIKNN